MKQKLPLVALAILIFTLVACSSTEIESLPAEEDIFVEIVDTSETAPSVAESLLSPLAAEEAEEPEATPVEEIAEAEPVAISLDESATTNEVAEASSPDEATEVVSEDVVAKESEVIVEPLVLETSVETLPPAESLVPAASTGSPIDDSMLMIAIAVLSALLVLLFVVSIVIGRKNRHSRRKWESPMR